MIKIFPYFFIAWLCGVIIVIIIGRRPSKCPKDIDKKEIPVKYQAVIIKKYLDSSKHPRRPSQIIRLYNKKDQRIIELFSSDYEDDLWEKTKVGDSIYKLEGSLDLYVPDGGWDTTVIRYKCPPESIPNWK